MSGRAWYCCNRRRGAQLVGDGAATLSTGVWELARTWMRTGKTMVANSSGPSSRSDLLPSSYATLRYSTLRRAKVPWVGQRRAISSVASPPSSLPRGGRCGRESERVSTVWSRTQGAVWREGAVWYSAAQRDALTWTDSYIRSPANGNGERKAGARSVRAPAQHGTSVLGNEHERRDPAVM